MSVRPCRGETLRQHGYEVRWVVTAAEALAADPGRAAEVVLLDLGLPDMDGRPLRLTRKEFDLLAVLAAKPGQVCSRDHLIDQIWHTTWEGPTRTLDVHIAALRNILDELVGNAARLSGGTQVTVAASAESGQVMVRVADDGSGLTAEQRRRAGERFWRGPAHQNVPGTGMGLAICREVVGSWAGTLELHSVTPHGLEARISLPAANANGH